MTIILRDDIERKAWAEERMRLAVLGHEHPEIGADVFIYNLRQRSIEPARYSVERPWLNDYEPPDEPLDDERMCVGTKAEFFDWVARRDGSCG